jgi:hypothetical protein
MCAYHYFEAFVQNMRYFETVYSTCVLMFQIIRKFVETYWNIHYFSYDHYSTSLSILTSHLQQCCWCVQSIMSICLRALKSNVRKTLLQSLLSRSGVEVRQLSRISRVTKKCHVTSVATLHQCRNGDVSLFVRTVDQEQRCLGVLG